MCGECRRVLARIVRVLLGGTSGACGRPGLRAGPSLFRGLAGFGLTGVSGGPCLRLEKTAARGTREGGFRGLAVQWS